MFDESKCNECGNSGGSVSICNRCISESTVEQIVSGKDEVMKRKNKRCPWCKNTRTLENVLVVNEMDKEVKRFIECKGCGTRGPWVFPCNDPWSVWNCR